MLGILAVGNTSQLLMITLEVEQRLPDLLTQLALDEYQQWVSGAQSALQLVPGIYEAIHHEQVNLYVKMCQGEH